MTYTKIYIVIFFLLVSCRDTTVIGKIKKEDQLKNNIVFYKPQLPSHDIKYLLLEKYPSFKEISLPPEKKYTENKITKKDLCNIYFVYFFLKYEHLRVKKYKLKSKIYMNMCYSFFAYENSLWTFTALTNFPVFSTLEQHDLTNTNELLKKLKRVLPESNYLKKNNIHILSFLNDLITNSNYNRDTFLRGNFSQPYTNRFLLEKRLSTHINKLHKKKYILLRYPDGVKIVVFEDFLYNRNEGFIVISDSTYQKVFNRKAKTVVEYLTSRK